MFNPVSIARPSTASSFQREARPTTPASNTAKATITEQSASAREELQHAGDTSREQYQSRSTSANAVAKSASDSASESTAELTQALQNRFTTVASNKEEFHALMQQTFDENYDVGAAD